MGWELSPDLAVLLAQCEACDVLNTSPDLAVGLEGCFGSVLAPDLASLLPLPVPLLAPERQMQMRKKFSHPSARSVGCSGDQFPPQ